MRQLTPPVHSWVISKGGDIITDWTEVLVATVLLATD